MFNITKIWEKALASMRICEDFQFLLYDKSIPEIEAVKAWYSVRSYVIREVLPCYNEVIQPVISLLVAVVMCFTLAWIYQLLFIFGESSSKFFNTIISDNVRLGAFGFTVFLVLTTMYVMNWLLDPYKRQHQHISILQDKKTELMFKFKSETVKTLKRVAIDQARCGALKVNLDGATVSTTIDAGKAYTISYENSCLNGKSKRWRNQEIDGVHFDVVAKISANAGGPYTAKFNFEDDLKIKATEFYNQLGGHKPEYLFKIQEELEVCKEKAKELKVSDLVPVNAKSAEPDTSEQWRFTRKSDGWIIQNEQTHCYLGCGDDILRGYVVNTKDEDRAEVWVVQKISRSESKYRLQTTSCNSYLAFEERSRVGRLKRAKEEATDWEVENVIADVDPAPEQQDQMMRDQIADVMDEKSEYVRGNLGKFTGAAMQKYESFISLYDHLIRNMAQFGSAPVVLGIELNANKVTVIRGYLMTVVALFVGSLFGDYVKDVDAMLN